MGGVLFGFWRPDQQAPGNVGHIGGTKELGKLIYTQYVYAFEIAAVVLLVAIIAAVALTLRRRKDTKHFDPADQYISGLERAVRFSPAQELAWVMRFGSDKEFEAALLATLQYAKEAMQ